MRSVKTLLFVAPLALAVPLWLLAGGAGPSPQDDHKDQGHEGHAHGAHDHAHAAVGTPAPDFALKDLTGKEVKLSAHKGKIVVLEWTNNECPFVARHQRDKKTMQSTFKKFEGKPVVWLAINSSYFCADKADEIRTWAKDNNLPYAILLDAEGTVGHQYAAKTTPHMFVIDKEGVLRYQGGIDDDPAGQKDNARNYVEEAVNALLDGSTIAQTESKPYGCTVRYKRG
jgi:peroxiredoxin